MKYKHIILIICLIMLVMLIAGIMSQDSGLAIFIKIG